MTADAWPSDPPLIAVIRVAEARRVTDDQLLALARQGLSIEIAMTCAGATELITRAARLLGSTVRLGAGTVLSAPDADFAETAGAQYLTSPALWPGFESRRVPTVPGVLTPTEVAQALALGFRRLKLFPARHGPAHLRDLRAVFPDVALWPSGGVSEENVAAWRDAGAGGLFIGQSLVGGPADVAEPEVLEARAAAIVAAWRD